MSDTPFSFAVQAAPARHADEWVSLAVRAEELGYRALLTPDHQGSGGGLTGMAVAGAATTSLRVGTLMTAVDFHHPAVLTQELVTLDALLGGRVEVGLGAGWMIRDYERTGVPMDPPGTRIDRLREFVSTVRTLWTEGSADVDGRWYRLRGAQAAPRPTTPAPFLVLGGGGRRMLRLAAEYADVISIGAPMNAGDKSAPLGSGATLEAFDRRREWIEGTPRLVDTVPEIQCLAYETYIGEDAADYAERHVCDSFGLPVESVLASPLALLGTVDEVCDKLQRLRERLHITYWVVKSAVMHDFAPVVARLAGR